MTAGMKSSEFLATVCVVALGTVNKKLGLGLEQGEIITLAGVVSAYAISRGMAKMKAAQP